MEASENNINRETRKRNIRLIAGLFFGLLILCTLFSNTLLGLTLPKVTTETPSSGTLDREFKGTAMLEPVMEVDLSNPAGTNITKVLVKEGELVKKGQILVQYDISEAEQQVEAERDMLKRLKLPLKSLQYAYIEASHNADPHAQNAAQMALESANMDVSAQEKRVQTLQSQIAGKQELKAPFAGIVKEVNAVEGLASNTGAADIRLANAEKGLQFELQVPVDIAATLAIGDPLEVTIFNKESRSIQGRIIKIEESDAPDQSAKSGDDVQEGDPLQTTNRLLVNLHDELLQGGEWVQVNLIGAGNDKTIIISTKAVHIEKDGAYVFVVADKHGPLGNVSYASKVSVTITAANAMKTAVAESFFDDQQIIVESSEPLQDGTQIRMLHP
ncbi:efflux RND transporter periplasmic adaptor subunit [Paenibacillus psychroresistens]|uniref:Efflux RND transporter periplasmic adaptor subunit n=1 Tax=Paenibacillus psychroresistens TaxID=1778678 RepID=A0A6B8RQ36_9BACL|nr:efflux RND transporter periplasmic adaptor subunit [Paenibacillus psychroresistens]QGQ97623.1 efflux RND transporter periplasmic adaptor subunit [Paenibacillus psychroresistens]